MLKTFLRLEVPTVVRTVSIYGQGRWLGGRGRGLRPRPRRGVSSAPGRPARGSAARMPGGASCVPRRHMPPPPPPRALTWECISSLAPPRAALPASSCCLAGGGGAVYGVLSGLEEAVGAGARVEAVEHPPVAPDDEEAPVPGDHACPALVGVLLEAPLEVAPGLVRFPHVVGLTLLQELVHRVGVGAVHADRLHEPDARRQLPPETVLAELSECRGLVLQRLLVELV